MNFLNEHAIFQLKSQMFEINLSDVVIPNIIFHWLDEPILKNIPS